MPCSRHTRSKMWPIHRAVGPSRYFGRSAKAMPLSVSTVWIAYGNAATTSRRKAAPFILVAASKKATWANFDTRSIARNRCSLPWASRSSQTSMWTPRSRSAGRRAGSADRRLGEAAPLRGVLLVPRQARDAVPHEAAVQGAAAELRDGLTQAAQDVVERQQGAPPELDDDRLLGLGEHGAARSGWSHRPVGGRGPTPPFGDVLRVQPVAGGQGAGRLLRRLELGSNSRRRAGAAVKTCRHSASSSSREINAPRHSGTAHLACTYVGSRVGF